MEITGRMIDIKRMAIHDGPGVRTTLFLKGCSLKCIWCHNPEGISTKSQLAYYAHKCIECMECVMVCPTSAHSRIVKRHAFDRSKCVVCGACENACLGDALRIYGNTVTVDKAYALVTEDRAFYGENGGVTVSGGEPLLQADFVNELFVKLKENCFRTAVDTCGNVPWSSFEKVMPLTDVFLYDIKHIDSDAHKLLTGAGNELILENLCKLSDSGVKIEIRIPLVPGANDEEDTLAGIGKFLSGRSFTKVKILPYHSLARSKYSALDMEDTMPNVEMPTKSALINAISILRDYGINAVSGLE